VFSMRFPFSEFANGIDGRRFSPHGEWREHAPTITDVSLLSRFTTSTPSVGTHSLDVHSGGPISCWGPVSFSPLRCNRPLAGTSLLPEIF